MARRVFLHVGSPKTGTTYLQSVLWGNRNRLAENGLLLPGGSIHAHFRAALDVRNTPGRHADPDLVENAWERLVREAVDWDGDVLVSHEMMAATSADHAAAGVGRFSDHGAEVHIIVTARDLARQLPAEWQERIKHRSVIDFPTFMAQATDPDSRVSQRLWPVQDYVSIVERWGPPVGSDRVHVVTVPPSGEPKTVFWVRFASVLGLDPDSYDQDVSRANRSLGLVQAALLRRVNAELGERLPLPGRYTGMVKGLLAHEVLERRPGERIVLGGDDLAFARKRSEEVAAGLRALGVDVVGSLDDLAVPDQGEDDPAVSTARAEVPLEDLFAESIAATIELLDRVGERSDAWHEERRRLREDLTQVRRRLQLRRAEVEELRQRVAELDARRLRARAGRLKRTLLGAVGR